MAVVSPTGIVSYTVCFKEGEYKVQCVNIKGGKRLKEGGEGDNAALRNFSGVLRHQNTPSGYAPGKPFSVAHKQCNNKREHLLALKVKQIGQR